MKKIGIWIVTALCAMALSATASENVRTMSQEYSASGLSLVKIDVQVGEMNVAAYDGDAVQIEMIVSCNGNDSCRDVAERMELSSSVSRGRLSLKTKKLPKHMSNSISVELNVKLPRNLAMKGHVGVGKLNVWGVDKDIAVDMGVGDVRLTGKRASVRSVSLDVDVGDAELSVPGENPMASGSIGKKLRWQGGKGNAGWKAHVGVGDARASLD
jgi:hypothetical protein